MATVYVQGATVAGKERGKDQPRRCDDCRGRRADGQRWPVNRGCAGTCASANWIRSRDAVVADGPCACHLSGSPIGEVGSRVHSWLTAVDVIQRTFPCVSLAAVGAHGAGRVPVDVLVLLDPQVSSVTITPFFRSSRPSDGPWPLSAVGVGPRRVPEGGRSPPHAMTRLEGWDPWSRGRPSPGSRSLPFSDRVL